MTLTKTQGDLLLDLYEQCLVTNQAFEQFKAARSQGKPEKEAAIGQAVETNSQAVYVREAKLLTELCCEALSSDIPNELIEGMMASYLTSDLEVELQGA